MGAIQQTKDQLCDLLDAVQGMVDNAVTERDTALGLVRELEGACARALSNLRNYFDDDERSSGWLDNAEGELEKVSAESKEGGA